MRPEREKRKKKEKANEGGQSWELVALHREFSKKGYLFPPLVEFSFFFFLEPSTQKNNSPGKPPLR